MLTLSEAEALLSKGYVFGGHGCTLCMANQPAVDFSDYDAVSLEYVAAPDSPGQKSRLSLPFYAFYKYIGENEYGIPTYAKTYVPAIEISGLEEYFSQHRD